MAKTTNNPLKMAEVTINEMSDMIFDTYMVAFNTPDGEHSKYLPIHFVGMPGLGKTAGFRQAGERIAKSLNRECVFNPTMQDYQEWEVKGFDKVFFLNDIRISQMSSLDVRGLVARSDADRNKMTWLAPDWLPTHPDIAGMNFFDEIQLGRPEVQAAAYQIINERQVGNLKLSPNVMQIAASNPVAAGGVNYGIPPALANRFLHVSVIEDAESFGEWAINHGINPFVRAYIQWQQADLLVFPIDNPDQLSYPTPRTWEMVSYALKVPNERMRDKLIVASIGAEHALKFTSYLNETSQLPDPRKILVDGQMLYPNRADLKYAQLEAVLSAVENDTTQIGNFLKWMTGKELPADLQAYGFKMALNGGKQFIVRDKKFIEMMRTNPRLSDLIVYAR